MSQTHTVLQQRLAELCRAHGLLDKEVTVRARVLATEEAIGHPEDDDFPLQKGRERLMQAEVEGARGQAFTDQFGDFAGRLRDVVAMDLPNNYRRAVFVAALNAVASRLGIASGTVHCRDQEPGICAARVAEHIRALYGRVRLAQIGFQPRLVERLQREHEYRILDMDPDHIGTRKGGVIVEGPEAAADAVRWADLLLVTGTTLVNDTIDHYVGNSSVLFYGTTIAGAASLMGWDRVCPCSH